MEATIGKFFDSVSALFSGGDHMPWCDRNTIAGCEREVAEAATAVSDEQKNESIMRLSWALVHSRQPEDVQRGIAMLKASLATIVAVHGKRGKSFIFWLLDITEW